MDALEAFSCCLREARDDWTSVQLVFSHHVASSFVHDFISRELSALSKTSGHIVRKSVSQTNFTFIDDQDFEYSLRLLVPFPIRPRTFKWLGMRQIIAARGPGSVTIRKLMVPPCHDIAAFQRGVVIEDVGRLCIGAGDVVASQNAHEVLDIEAVLAPAVVEILTYRSDGAGLLWTFDQSMKSVYAEQSSLLLSRVRNVFELAYLTGRPVPDDIYALALDPERPHVALLAIRSMLVSGHPEAFIQLHRAMESESKDLSEGARDLLDLMTIDGGDSRAG
jgi:hypothetical protein